MQGRSNLCLHLLDVTPGPTYNENIHYYLADDELLHWSFAFFMLVAVFLGHPRQKGPRACPISEQQHEHLGPWSGAFVLDVQELGGAHRPANRVQIPPSVGIPICFHLSRWTRPLGPECTPRHSRSGFQVLRQTCRVKPSFTKAPFIGLHALP